MASGITVRGLREFSILCAKAGPVAKKGLNTELRLVAEPIRSDAQALAESGIRRIGPRWGLMRVGVTRTLVYVAPRQRGVSRVGRSRARRPKFAELMRERAMDPALERNKANIAGSVERLFDHYAQSWNRRGL